MYGSQVRNPHLNHTRTSPNPHLILTLSEVTESMVLFVCGVIAFAYVLELCVWTKWLWEGTAVQEALQYKSRTSPGCMLGRYLLPLCLLGCYRTYIVIDSAIAVSQNMKRNVDQLKKLADFLPASDDMARIRTGLFDIVSRQVSHSHQILTSSSPHPQNPHITLSTERERGQETPVGYHVRSLRGRAVQD